MVLHFSAHFTQGPSHLQSVCYLIMTRLASTCTAICALSAPPVLRICVCGELIVMGDGFTRKLCCSGLPNLFNKCAYLYSTQCVSIYTVILWFQEYTVITHVMQVLKRHWVSQLYTSFEFTWDSSIQFNALIAWVIATCAVVTRIVKWLCTLTCGHLLARLGSPFACCIRM